MLNPFRNTRIGLVAITIAALALGLSTNTIGFWGLLLALMVGIYLVVVLVSSPRAGRREAS